MDQFGEESEDAPLKWFAGESVAEQVGVAGRHGVVGGPGVVELTGNAHAVSRWLTSANSASNLIEPQSVMTFASPSADCGACWSSMRFMIGERAGQVYRRPLDVRSRRRQGVLTVKDGWRS